MNTTTLNKKSEIFLVKKNLKLSTTYSLLILSPLKSTPLLKEGFKPGQFVEVLPPDNSTFLRRPISVCNIDEIDNSLWLLIRDAGKGTHALIGVSEGDRLEIIYPLGHGFSTTLPPNSKVLLIGGGVGVAPLLYLGKQLLKSGINPAFLLGARSASDLLLSDEFEELGTVYYSTDNGSKGTPGVVTHNPILSEEFDMIYCCGPMPMMKAVAAIARQKKIQCEVSLENVMGCGLGACLCCVEKTIDQGNVCVCTEGPVFNINRLSW